MKTRTAECLAVADYVVERLNKLRETEERWSKELKFAPWHPPGVMCVNLPPPPKHLMQKYHLPLFSVVGKVQSTHILTMEHVGRREIDAFIDEWDDCLLSQQKRPSLSRRSSASPVATTGFHKLPLVGFGTFKLHGDDCRSSVEAAVASGYKLIDTAHVYKNLEHVGALPSSVQLVHKIDHHVTTGKEVESSFNEDLSSLGREAVDVLMLHYFPKEHCNRQDMWTAVLNEKKRGRTKLTGVSNFSREQLEMLFGGQHSDFWPDVLQVSAAVCDDDLIALCRSKQIDLMVYGVMGSQGSLAKAQRFIDQNIVTLVSSTREEHILDNIERLNDMVGSVRVELDG